MYFVSRHSPWRRVSFDLQKQNEKGGWNFQEVFSLSVLEVLNSFQKSVNQILDNF